MTLTAPGCGMGPVIAEDARQKIAALPTVESAKVHIVWDPIWTPQMISPEGCGGFSDYRRGFACFQAAGPSWGLGCLGAWPVFSPLDPGLRRGNFDQR